MAAEGTNSLLGPNTRRTKSLPVKDITSEVCQLIATLMKILSIIH